MIKSMTAFARASSEDDWGTATWEIRSVNHRYLDISVRLPEMLRHLEIEAKNAVKAVLTRGKVECTLKFSPGEESTPELSINHHLVKALSSAATQVFEQLPGIAPFSTMDVLSWNGVLISQPMDLSATEKAVIELLKGSLIDMVDARQREGKALQAVISQRLESVMSELAKIQAALPEILSSQREKIQSTVLALAEDVLDEGRIEQEVAFMTQKMDIGEEIDRITTHVDEVWRVLNAEEPVGRRLDFLMQEVNREANTIASKSVASKTSLAAVEMKVLIEQMREQVQNIE